MESSKYDGQKRQCEYKERNSVWYASKAAGK